MPHEVLGEDGVAASVVLVVVGADNEVVVGSWPAALWDLTCGLLRSDKREGQLTYKSGSPLKW